VPTDFSVFGQQAHVERIEHAIVELLLADAQLHTFFNGQIFVVPEPLMFPDREVPFLTVCGVSHSSVFQLNSEGEVSLPVALGGFYDELREVVESVAERTVKSLFERLQVVLASDRLLQSTSVSSSALVDRIEKFETVPFPPISDGDEGNAIFNFQMVVTYQYMVDIDTGLKA
jgi:hypothetical protein